MVSKIITAAPIGFDGCLIEVEGDASKSLPSLQIVGLGNKAIEEAKERVRSAINNSLLEFPKKRITINLAPAELPKDGSHYDLPIALAILCLSGQLKQSDIENAAFAGELGLDGNIKPIKGAINITQASKLAGIKKIYIPKANLKQAQLIDGIEAYGVDSLKQLYLHLKNEALITIEKPNTVISDTLSYKYPLLDDIIGQEQAKRALMISAAGHHNILLSGPPGAGKTMLAKTLTNLLPKLSQKEQIAVTKIYSLYDGTDEIIFDRPFRSPHHTASRASIIGGGNKPKPGEISLAHTGVLFLDELPEYPRSIIEAMRQPLEDKKIDIARANSHLSYPSDFTLVATMNPCPCGYYGDPTHECTCTPTQVAQYKKKLSGPLLDRIDLTLNVAKVPSKDFINNKSLKNNQHLYAVDRINMAIQAQKNRYNSSYIYNGSLSNSEIKRYISLDTRAEKLLKLAAEKLSLSARSYFKTIKVAQTIADIDGQKEILSEHISEALQYRQTIS